MYTQVHVGVCTYASKYVEKRAQYEHDFTLECPACSYMSSIRTVLDHSYGTGITHISA